MKHWTLLATALLMSVVSFAASPRIALSQDEAVQDAAGAAGQEVPAVDERAPAADQEGEGRGGLSNPVEPNLSSEAQAEKPALAAEGNVTVETIVSDLVNPSGIAIQPGTGMVFVADSGAHRIIKFDPANPTEVTEVVTGFTNDVYGKGPMYDIGPLGLLFLNESTLVVGGGGKPDGEEQVFVFTLPEDGAAVAADAATTTLGPIVAGEQSQNGEGNFYALAATSGALFVSSNGDDTKGWILKATRSLGTLSDLRPFIATKEAIEIDAPVALAINPNPNGGHLVVGQMGEISIPKDSHLTFYHPETGELMLNLETGLFDIAGLAYGPDNGIHRLYAVDFAWMDAAQGGVFRLEKDQANGAQVVKAVRIATLDKPSALTFDNAGVMYVTVFGASEDESEKTGSVVRITGAF